MQAIQGLQSAYQLSPFMSVALEYVTLRDTGHWVHIPHILTLSDPDTERFILESRTLAATFTHEAADHRYDARFHRRNLLIEMRERIPEVAGALQAHKDIVNQDGTITKLGLRDNRYYFGLIVRPQDIEHLKTDPELRHCDLRPVSLRDFGYFTQWRNVRPTALAA